MDGAGPAAVSEALLHHGDADCPVRRPVRPARSGRLPGSRRVHPVAAQDGQFGVGLQSLGWTAAGAHPGSTLRLRPCRPTEIAQIILICMHHRHARARLRSRPERRISRAGRRPAQSPGVIWTSSLAPCQIADYERPVIV